MHRTGERKRLIREAYHELFGLKLAGSCSTCYIEAVLRILKYNPMPSSKYELKKGVVLQAFGHPEKTCTNLTITDELGDWYMEHFPEKVVYFVRYPRPAKPAGLANVKIINKQPEQPAGTTEQPAGTPEQLIAKTIDDLTNKPAGSRRKKPGK